MRTNLRSLKLIIIDEVSMLSNLNLAYIYLRLEELFVTGFAKTVPQELKSNS